MPQIDFKTCIWMLLKTLKNIFLPSDPRSVNLEKVSNIIVDQSLKDAVFSKEAGRICYTILQVCVTCDLSVLGQTFRVSNWAQS